LYLNHDQDFEPVFMNSSIVAMALCLLGYKSLGGAQK
jgi:hypothetical protein